MAEDTILELITRSIAKGPIGQGSQGCVYSLDDPEFDGYLIKIRHEYLETPTKLKPGLLTGRTRMYGVDYGFAKSNIGQMLLCDENRRFFTLLKQRGEPLEARLHRYRKEKANNFEACQALMDDLMALPDEGLQEFFSDIMKATNQNVGIDIMGYNNVFISENGLHLLDIPVWLDTYFEPELFNHVHAINTFMDHLLDPLQEGLTTAQQENLKVRIAQFEARLGQVAESMSFPKTAAEVETYMKEKKILFTGVKDVQGVVLTMGDSRRMLKDAAKKVETFTACAV